LLPILFFIFFIFGNELFPFGLSPQNPKQNKIVNHNFGSIPKIEVSLFSLTLIILFSEMLKFSPPKKKSNKYSPKKNLKKSDRIIYLRIYQLSKWNLQY